MLFLSFFPFFLVLVLDPGLEKLEKSYQEKKITSERIPNLGFFPKHFQDIYVGRMTYMLTLYSTSKETKDVHPACGNREP